MEEARRPLASKLNRIRPTTPPRRRVVREAIACNGIMGSRKRPAYGTMAFVPEGLA